MDGQSDRITTFAALLSKARGLVAGARRERPDFSFADDPLRVVGRGGADVAKLQIVAILAGLLLVLLLPATLIVLVFTRGLWFQILAGLTVVDLLVWLVGWLRARRPLKEWHATAQVHPGALVMANSVLFEPGEEVAPGVLVVTLDQALAADPQRLAELGGRLGRLQEEPDGRLSGELQLLRTWLEEGQQWAKYDRVKVPAALAGNDETYMVGLRFSREAMPAGCIDRPVWLVLLRPGCNESAELLPMEFWHAPEVDHLMGRVERE